MGLETVGTLQPNDEVLSERGEYVTIKRVLEHKYTGNMLRIETASGSIECTPEHQILVARRYKTSDTPDDRLDINLQRVPANCYVGDLAVEVLNLCTRNDIESFRSRKTANLLALSSSMENLTDSGGVH